MGTQKTLQVTTTLKGKARQNVLDLQDEIKKKSGELVGKSRVVNALLETSNIEEALKKY